MKIMTILLVGFLVSLVYANETEISKIGVDNAFKTINSCKVPSTSIELAKNQIFNELGIASSGFVNLTDSNCWERDGGQSFYMNFIVKADSSSLEGKRVSVSFSSYDFDDIDAPFTHKQRQQIGYSLKNKYFDYLKTGIDENFYIRISLEHNKEKNTCNSLREYFKTLDNEKYFNENDNHCEIIVKTKTSEITKFISENTNYISYFGDKIDFLFEGVSEGTFNLANLKNSINCNLETDNEFYIEDVGECYGSYNNKERIYFSASQQFTDSWANINLFGYIDGRAKISISLSGKDAKEHKNEAQTFFSSVTTKFFGKSLVPELKEQQKEVYAKEESSEEPTYYYFNGEALINDLTLNNNALVNLKFRENKMNKDYSDEYIHLTISVPYIQLYINNKEIEVFSGKSEDTRLMPLPYYANDIVITKDKVFANVALSEKNESLAKDFLNKKVKNFVQIDDWEFNIQTTGENNYFLIRGYDENSGLLKSLETQGKSSSTETNSGEIIINDEFSSEHPEFTEFENESEIQLPKLEEIIKKFLEIFKVIKKED